MSFRAGHLLAVGSLAPELTHFLRFVPSITAAVVGGVPSLPPSCQPCSNELLHSAFLGSVCFTIRNAEKITLPR